MRLICVTGGNSKFSGHEYYFSIPEKDNLKFIEGNKVEKEEHISRFGLIKATNGEKRRGGKRDDNKSGYRLRMGRQVRGH